MYNGNFNQCLEIIISTQDHRSCLFFTNAIKKQCDAWFFCVKYDESKSARKGPVLERTLMIYQNSHASDIVIFKEAVRRICFHISTFHNGAAKFTDRGSEPENDLRTRTF